MYVYSRMIKEMELLSKSFKPYTGLQKLWCSDTPVEFHFHEVNFTVRLSFLTVYFGPMTKMKLQEVAITQDYHWHQQVWGISSD